MQLRTLLLFLASAFLDVVDFSLELSSITKKLQSERMTSLVFRSSPPLLSTRYLPRPVIMSDSDTDSTVVNSPSHSRPRLLRPSVLRQKRSSVFRLMRSATALALSPARWVGLWMMHWIYMAYQAMVRAVFASVRPSSPPSPRTPTFGFRFKLPRENGTALETLTRLLTALHPPQARSASLRSHRHRWSRLDGHLLRRPRRRARLRRRHFRSGRRGRRDLGAREQDVAAAAQQRSLPLSSVDSLEQGVSAEGRDCGADQGSVEEVRVGGENKVQRQSFPFLSPVFCCLDPLDRTDWLPFRSTRSLRSSASPTRRRTREKEDTLAGSSTTERKEFLTPWCVLLLSLLSLLILRASSA